MENPKFIEKEEDSFVMPEQSSAVQRPVEEIAAYAFAIAAKRDPVDPYSYMIEDEDV